MKKTYLFLSLFLSCVAQTVLAGLFIEPYYAVSSTKKITSNRKEQTQTTSISQREEKGIKAGLSLGRWFQFGLSLGQNFNVATTTESAIEDEYHQIDFSQDLNSSTSDQEKKKKETQNKANIFLGIRPNFWIFTFQTKIGVSATQRIIKFYASDVLLKETDSKITYKPLASAGFGVNLWRGTFFAIDYGAYFFSFPKLSPFERQLSVSYGLNF